MSRMWVKRWVRFVKPARSSSCWAPIRSIDTETMTITLGVMGCGLIGGSLALALRHAGVVGHVVGYSPDPASLAQALDFGVIDEAAATAQDVARGVDVLVIAVPVAATRSCLEQVAGVLQRHTLVMDVGSTKIQVVQAARQALGDKLHQFVPTHPIAGKEQSGAAHAQADLFVGRRVVMTPLEGQDPQWGQRAGALWEATGALVSTLSAQQHDEALAAVSHLPHLLAYAYMQAIGGQAQAQQHLSLAGSGFRDFTRIAAADAAVWRDIFLSNPAAVGEQLRSFRLALSELEQLIHSGQADALSKQLQAAAQIRRQWGQQSESAQTGKGSAS